MDKDGWKGILRRGLSDPRRGDISLFAANGSYYLILSLGPLTALLLSILPFTPLTRAEFLEGLLSGAPGPVRHLVKAVVEDISVRSGTALPLSLALELWSGARFLASVVRGAGELLGGGRGYFRRRLMGAVCTAVLAAFILCDLTLLLAGERTLTAVRRLCPSLAPLWKTVLHLRPLIFLGGLTGGNALLFRYVSGRGGRHGPRWPGALLAAGVWLLFSRGYSWVMERFGLFGIYGSIAAVAATMCWGYGSLYILFAGAWLNTLLEPDK